MESPDGTPAPGILAAEPVGRGVSAETISVAAIYSLMLTAYGAFVFYASASPGLPSGPRPHTALAAVLLALNVMWLVMPAALTVLGLAHLHQSARLTWRPAAAWVSAVTASAAIGLLNIHYFDHWDGYGPYWPALIAAAGQLTAGAAMITLIAVTGRSSAAGIARPGRRAGSGQRS